MGKENKFSLFDFEGASDVANNLIDKLASGIGWIANRNTPKKIAADTYIEEIKKMNCSPELKAALISQTDKIIKEYCNQNDIVHIAINELNEDTNPKNVEDDWIALFMDQARLISDSVFQEIWGRILAQECNVNNSIPKTLLYTLAQMDKEDAQAFTALCSITVKINEEYEPIIVAGKLREYERWGITFDSLINLGALGLVKSDLGPLAPGYIIESDKTTIKITYFDLEYEVEKNNKELRIGNVMFTKSGQALCKAISVEKKEDFWEHYCLPFWKEN